MSVDELQAEKLQFLHRYSGRHFQRFSYKLFDSALFASPYFNEYCTYKHETSWTYVEIHADYYAMLGFGIGPPVFKISQIKVAGPPGEDIRPVGEYSKHIKRGWLRTNFLYFLRSFRVLFAFYLSPLYRESLFASICNIVFVSEVSLY